MTMGKIQAIFSTGEERNRECPLTTKRAMLGIMGVAWTKAVETRAVIKRRIRGGMV